MSRLTSSALQRLHDLAVATLAQNDLGDSTKPAPNLYPHQWLWDSCFIAIGLRHLDPNRAAKELLSLFRGQWQNGMLPHEIFNSGAAYHAGPDKWASAHIPAAPRGVETTFMTQPPMVAEAAVLVGRKLPPAERTQFYQQIFPGLVRYHQWLYTERDPFDTGLVMLIHPWEAGSEDLPYWSALLRDHAPLRIKTLRSIGQEELLRRFRPDLRHAPADQRPTTADFLAFYRLLDRLRPLRGDFSRMLATPSLPLVYDVLFNAILIRANQQLQTIATELDQPLPTKLQASIAKAPQAFETLVEDGLYWSRQARTGELLKGLSYANLMGLYAGTVPPQHAARAAELLQSPTFWPRYGVASTPTDSPYFRPRAFWRGPVWVNANWLLAHGLDRSGYPEVAARLRHTTLDLVAGSEGMFENYEAQTGRPGGTPDFSWTAALVLDLLVESHR